MGDQVNSPRSVSNQWRFIGSKFGKVLTSAALDKSLDSWFDFISKKESSPPPSRLADGQEKKGRMEILCVGGAAKPRSYSKSERAQGYCWLKHQQTGLNLLDSPFRW
ncbi:hypothetical protein AA313_de0203222 [Arthrobotrys entomopaga]|nr:hypothetical protein AA313_de0203222 [Arthrobotrys entomopaga]